MLKDFANTLTSLGRAFEVASGANFLCDGHTLRAKKGDMDLSVGVEQRFSSGSATTYLFWADRPLTRLTKLLDDLGVSAQVLLAADEDDGQILAEMQHFADPL